MLFDRQETLSRVLESTTAFVRFRYKAFLKLHFIIRNGVPLHFTIRNTVPYNKPLTNRACSGRTGEYWHSVVAVRTSLRSVRTTTTSGQYSPVRPSRSVSKRLIFYRACSYANKLWRRLICLWNVSWKAQLSLQFFYNITCKLTQFQPRNLLTSSACSIILWTSADDAMTPLKCMSVNFQWAWRN